MSGEQKLDHDGASAESRLPPVIDKPVLIAEPLLPDLKDLIPLLEGIWERKYVTNHGPLHEQLEAELADHLGVKTAMLFNNATIGLIAVVASPEIFAASCGVARNTRVKRPFSFSWRRTSFRPSLAQ